MRTSLAVLALLVVVLVAGVESQWKQSCKEGDVWMDDCNRCHCVGGNPACTRKLCPGSRPRPSVETKCADGDRWREDCNSCWCVGGNKMCTKKACNNKALRDTHQRV